MSGGDTGDAACPPLDGVLETVLYVDDLVRTTEFYADVMGLSPIFSDDRMAAFHTGDDRVLLLFLHGGSLDPVETPGGMIPPHDGSGPVHIAFGIADTDFPAWEKHLGANGIAIESRVDWPHGGHSIYFRDPDNHVLELASRRLWARA